MTDISSTSGGAGAAGGFGFQANLGAIAAVHTLRGTPLQWTEGLTAAAPCAVSFETSGPGDDLSLELTDGSVVEIQAKKGLCANGRFWSALDALCEGIHHNRCRYGILIVCPNSSGPVKKGYAQALERIGDGRTDADSLEQKLTSRLAGRGYNPQAVCSRIRIRTVSALVDAGDAIAAARAELGHICADQQQVVPAWHVLCQDALSAIARKGRRTVGNLSEKLAAAQIHLEDTSKDSPVVICDNLIRWALFRTQEFEVPGMSRPLPTDRAWLPLTAVVRAPEVDPAPSVEKALADYHALGEKALTDGHTVDARTIGTFRRLCVVVGGPGSGKSLLLRVLSREFAKDSYASVHIRLRDLATRMQNTGCGVEEGLLELGLDGSGVSREQLLKASFSDLVLLCDGLDECGERQFEVASGLKSISASHPSYRILVTTRPMGYSTTELHDWRHYEIASLTEADTAEHLETLCRCALNEDSANPTDDLLPRIRAYLNEGSAASMLSRSPLLLAFGASLFLNWKEPSKTKLELYQRILRLIDPAPSPRETGPTPPAQAIRTRVLNQLGWLVTASPLLAAEELQRECAQTMEKALGVTCLQALTEVEASVRYWEERGLIERLQHPGISLIAFVHKTCGEFAAALHLSEMEPDEARQAIATVLLDPDWDEILDFAAETPLATMLAELLVAEFQLLDPDESTLNRLFRVLVRPEASLSAAKRRLFLERVFALARSEDRQKAYRVGLCLTNHDLSGMPEAQPMASPLLSAPTEWSRLVGWAVIACHFPRSVQRRALEAALANFMERSESPAFFVHPASRFPLGPLPDRRLFENFMLGALKALLPDRDAEYQDWLIAEVCRTQPDATMGFLYRFEALLRELGREGALTPLFRSWYGEPFEISISDGFEAGCAVLNEIVPAAFLGMDAGPPPRTGLKCLAALVEVAGIMRVPVSDFSVWRPDATHDEIHVLLRAAAHVYGLPTERLSAEAKQAVALGESLRKKGQSHTLLHVLPDVDVAEVDWSRAKGFDIDIGVVEGLVHHPSQWVRYLAAVLINERLHGPERWRACERMLAAGTGDALHAVAALTIGIPDGCELLMNRLERCDTAGLHHLFDHLQKQGWPVTPAHLPVLEGGLFNCGAKTAVSAARWCQETASSTDTWLEDLLRSASCYWLEHEEPYPKSGFVPDSPREALLRTLCAIAPPTIEELIKLARDPRSDVRDAAIDGLLGLARDTKDGRPSLVENILAKRFDPRQCEKLLGTDIPYRPEELSSLFGLLGDQDPAYRLVAVRHVLTHPGMDREKAIAAADPMRSDIDASVRDAVHQFLDQGAGRDSNPSIAQELRESI